MLDSERQNDVFFCKKVNSGQNKVISGNFRIKKRNSRLFLAVVVNLFIKPLLHTRKIVYPKNCHPSEYQKNCLLYPAGKARRNEQF